MSAKVTPLFDEAKPGAERIYDIDFPDGTSETCRFPFGGVVQSDSGNLETAGIQALREYLADKDAADRATLLSAARPQSPADFAAEVRAEVKRQLDAVTAAPAPISTPPVLGGNS